jgi:hypothetical protein
MEGVAVMFGTILAAITLIGSVNSATRPSVFDRSHYINANQILMIVTNEGLLGQDAGSLFGYGYGTFYPYTGIGNILNGTQIKSPLYSAGLWLGGTLSGGVRVAVSDFGTEYWPGSMKAGIYDPDADTLTGARVYKLYSDSAGSNPNTDYLQWPVAAGAPVDRFGHPLVRGDQTLWSVFNDANPSRHTSINGSTAPLKVEIQQLTWGTNKSGYEAVIYVEYRLFNRSTDTIKNFYVTPFFDPDLGGTQDDLTGCDSLAGVIFCYNATNSDLVYGSAPPAFGVKFLFGPIVASPGDSAYFFGRQVQGYRNIQMSSFVSYVNGNDPQSATESYHLMQGLRRNGLPLSNGTKFSYPGDPVAGTGDLDPNPSNPHFVASFGPFDFPPGDSQCCVIKLGMGQGADRLASLTALRAVLQEPDSTITGVDGNEGPALPTTFVLQQNFPNPFNPSTTIEYSLPARETVRLVVIDLLGRTVRTLVGSQQQAAGYHRVNWDGSSDDGTACSSGVYFYRLETGLGVESRKMVLLK